MAHESSPSSRLSSALVIFLSFDIDILTRVRQYLTVVLIRISLRVGAFDHISHTSGPFVSSFEECLWSYHHHHHHNFAVELSSLYILEITLLLDE